MHRYMRGISACVLLWGLSACSLLVHEKEQYIRFETPQVTGAHCAIKDYRAYHWNVYATPDTIRVEKGYPPLYITCTKEGYHSTLLEVGQRYDPQIVGDFVADKIGYVLPAWQDSAKQYPETITIWMRPLAFDSLESMEEWERSLWQFLRDEEDRMVATDKTLIGYASRMYTRMEEAWKRFDPPFRRVKRVEPLFDQVEVPAWKRELQKNEVWMASPEQEELLDGKKQWQKKTPAKGVPVKEMQSESKADVAGNGSVKGNDSHSKGAEEEGNATESPEIPAPAPLVDIDAENIVMPDEAQEGAPISIVPEDD